ncbi:ester cyclase [Halocatena halophila]|uniref:ester cyclase n=1 Tax=Halocatena halophila TaxID=2814576 RepID=UPI002ED5C206
MSDPETVITRLYDAVWNRADPVLADELVHEEYLIHDRELAEQLRGPELYKALASHTEAVFPDMEFTVEETITAGEMVALRWTMTGTHQGELFGIPPTDQPIELSAIEINRFDGGKLIETWTQSDQLGLLQQIGVSIEPP